MLRRTARGRRGERAAGGARRGRRSRRRSRRCGSARSRLPRRLEAIDALQLAGDDVVAVEDEQRLHEHVPAGVDLGRPDALPRVLVLDDGVDDEQGIGLEDLERADAAVVQLLLEVGPDRAVQLAVALGRAGPQLHGEDLLDHGSQPTVLSTSARRSNSVHSSTMPCGLPSETKADGRPRPCPGGMEPLAGMDSSTTALATSSTPKQRWCSPSPWSSSQRLISESESSGSTSCRKVLPTSTYVSRRRGEASSSWWTTVSPRCPQTWRSTTSVSWTASATWSSLRIGVMLRSTADRVCRNAVSHHTRVHLGIPRDKSTATAIIWRTFNLYLAYGPRYGRSTLTPHEAGS